MFKRIVDLFTSLDGLDLVVTLFVGIGCLSFVASAWLLHLTGEGRFASAACVGLVSLTLSAAAVVRVPLAVIAIAAAAITVGTAFLAGHLGMLLP